MQTQQIPAKHQAALAELYRALTTPAPAVEQPAPVAPAPRFPRPADFAERVPLGTVAGAVVYGEQTWDEDEGCVKHWGVEVELAGLTIHTDGEHLGIDQGEPGMAERWPLWAIGRLAELGAAGHLAEISRLARAWCAQPVSCAD